MRAYELPHHVLLHMAGPGYGRRVGRRGWPWICYESGANQPLLGGRRIEGADHLFEDTDARILQDSPFLLPFDFLPRRAEPRSKVGDVGTGGEVADVVPLRVDAGLHLAFLFSAPTFFEGWVVEANTERPYINGNGQP